MGTAVNRTAIGLIALLALASLPAPVAAAQSDRATARLVSELTRGDWVERRSKPARHGVYARAVILDAGCRHPAVYRFAPGGELSVTNDSCAAPMRLSARWALAANDRQKTVLSIDGAPVSLDAGVQYRSIVLRSNLPVQGVVPAMILVLDHK